MSLMQLLAMGRSIRNIKDERSPYKMTQQNLLPKFGPITRPERKTLEPDSASTPSAVAERSAPLISTAEITVSSSHAENSAEKEEPRVESVPAVPKPAAYPSGRWTLMRNPFNRKQTAGKETAPVQGELSLETIEVVRNDLTDADLEVVSVRKVENKSSQESHGVSDHETARLIWGRITSRFFGAGRT